MKTPIPAGWLKEFMEFMKHRRLCQSTMATEIPGGGKVTMQCELPDGHKGQHQSYIKLSWTTEQYLQIE